MGSSKLNISELHVIRPLNEGLNNVSESYYPSEDQPIEGGKQAEGAEPKKGISKSNFAWTKVDNKYFMSRKPNAERIPAGLYDIMATETEGLFLQAREVTLDELFQIPSDVLNTVFTDLEKFWKAKQKFQDYGFTYKRGILLHGPQGCGKTTLVNLLTKRIIDEYDGIVINVSTLSRYIPMVHNIRALEPDRPILAIIDELDAFIQYESTKDLLNVLDGNLQVDNIAYFASTNYIDRIEPRIKNRPSRFDRVLLLPPPDASAREFFLTHKLKEDDVARLGEERLKEIVSKTDQFSFAHLKELVISLAIMEENFDETIERLRNMGNG